MTGSPPAFTPQQREIIVAELRRIMAEPPPRNPRPYGCLTALSGIALFFLLPLAGVRPPSPWNLVLAVLLGLMILGGAVVGIFFGSGIYGRAAYRAQSALDALCAEPPPPEDECLRLAVELIAHSVVSEGPTTADTIDREAALQRLGGRSACVLAVERVLDEHLGRQ